MTLAHLKHNWQTVRDTGATVYEQCPTCGRRHVWQRTYGRELVDERWIRTGEFDRLTPPDARSDTQDAAYDPDNWEMRDVYGAVRPKR